MKLYVYSNVSVLLIEIEVNNTSFLYFALYTDSSNLYPEVYLTIAQLARYAEYSIPIDVLVCTPVSSTMRSDICREDAPCPVPLYHESCHSTN